MTYNQHVFYKTAWDTKPSREAAERTRLEQIKLVSLLTECANSVKFSNNRGKLLGSLMSVLQQLVKSSTSSKWEDENIPKGNLALAKAMQLVKDYYQSAKSTRAVKASEQKKRRTPNWEEKARASGVPVSSLQNKSRASTQSKLNKQSKAMTASKSKRGAAVAPSFRKKHLSKIK